jgi:hypothetical protein
MDPDTDSIFVIVLQDANKKLNFFIKVFCSGSRHAKMVPKTGKNCSILLFEGTFTSFFKDKKSKRGHKAVGIKVFLTILLGDRRIRIYTSMEEELTRSNSVWACVQFGIHRYVQVAAPQVTEINKNLFLSLKILIRIRSTIMSRSGHCNKFSSKYGTDDILI